MAKHIIGCGERDKWENSINYILVVAKDKLETPKLGEAKQGVAELLVNVIETEKAKATRWEVKYNRIVKSKEAKQFVLAFYTGIHVKQIPGNLRKMEQVSQSSSSGPITTQEPATQYSDVVPKAKAAGSAARAGSTARGPGRPKNSGSTGGALSK